VRLSVKGDPTVPSVSPVVCSRITARVVRSVGLAPLGGIRSLDESYRD